MEACAAPSRASRAGAWPCPRERRAIDCRGFGGAGRVCVWGRCAGLVCALCVAPSLHGSPPPVELGAVNHCSDGGKVPSKDVVIPGLKRRRFVVMM